MRSSGLSTFLLFGYSRTQNFNGMAKQFIGSKVPNVEITELATAPVDDFAVHTSQVQA
ncbi:hypothetical protein CsatA_029779 [Cannabis sativa]